MTTNREDSPLEGHLHHVVSADSLDEGDHVIVDIEGREIAVYNISGAYYALLNYCTHQGGPLCEGMVSGTIGVDDDFEWTYERDDQIISCPWHGWEFDITTGEHLANSRYKVPKYDVIEEGGELYVALG